LLPIGPVLLTLLWILVGFGLLGGAAAQLGLGSRGALLLTALALLGSLVDVRVADGLRINLGAGLVPLIAALFLLATEASLIDGLLTAGAGVVAAAGISAIGWWFPPGVPTELNLFAVDAQVLYALVGGTVAFVGGRTPRSAFTAALLGVLLADMTAYRLQLWRGQLPYLSLSVGGGGSWHTALCAAVLGAGLSFLFAPPRRRQVALLDSVHSNRP